MGKYGRVVDITGKVPGKNDVLLQSAPDDQLLKICVGEYLERAIKAEEKLDIATMQKILKARADKVKELNHYKFEPNQRIDDLIGILMIARSISQSKGIKFVPAWQRAKQGENMKLFTGKESWDGFIYEHVPLGAEKPSMEVDTIPVELKSLMINPYRDKFDSLIDLLQKKMPKFSKHFQGEGTICGILILPYATDPKNTSLSFDVKEATEIVNKHVNFAAIGCLLFLDIKTHEDGDTVISVKCHFVNKYPVLEENGNIENIALFDMTLAKFRKD